MLEAAEDRAKKEKRTEEFIAAYKSKMGLTIDPKIKAACEKVYVNNIQCFLICSYLMYPYTTYGLPNFWHM